MSFKPENGLPKNQSTKYGSIKAEDWEDLKNEADQLLQNKKGFCDQFCHPLIASTWSTLVFGWYGKILTLGNEKLQLDPSDLSTIPLPDRLTTRVSFGVFEKRWEEEKAKYKANKAQKSDANIGSNENGKKKKRKGEKKPPSGPSLAWTLFRAFGIDFVRAGLLKFVHDLLIFVGPQVLNSMIEYLGEDNKDASYGLLLTLVVTLSQLGMSFCLRHYFYRCYITGLQFRTAIVISVYRKALFLSAAERQIRSMGEITNLISVDAQRLQDLTTYLHAIWYSFLQISLSIYFLWQQLGPSCLAGVVIILIMMPVTKTVAGYMGRMQKKLMEAKDSRIEANNEVLQSMKVIKLQAWEQSFQDRIETLRAKEMKQLLHYILFNSFSIMLWTAVPLLVALATFAAYVISGNKLEVANALTSLALFEILRFPLFMLPNVINRLVEASISMNRVRSFLLSDEYVPLTKGNIEDIGINIEKASFVYESKRYTLDQVDRSKISEEEKKLLDSQWQVQLLKSQLADTESHVRELLLKSNTPKYLYGVVPEKVEKEPSPLPLETRNESPNLLSLRRVNFECKRGEFVVVVGPVGSGKSTFINSVLGEINALSGSVSVKGRLAYFAQSPFIMNETVKGNIVFGHRNEPFDAAKYQRAIETCALTHDLNILPDGDMCEIGEKGITLSGGQKARVAMARTVYHDAEIYLLDDPLAAVDAHVGKHMFQKCILEELLLKGNANGSNEKDKNTVILVTNALQYLNHPLVDKILVLKDGLIQESGKYGELIKDPNSLFSSYLASFQESLIENGGGNNNDAESDEEEAEEAKRNIISATKTSNSSLSALGDSTDVPEVSRVLAPRRASSSLKEIHENSATPKKDKESESVPKQSSKASGTLMTDEFAERATGDVSLEVYLSWARAAGGAWVGVAIIVFYLVVEGINVLSKWWLTYWGQNADHGGQFFFLGVYALIIMIGVLAQFGRVTFVMICGLRASKELFSKMLDSILSAPMAFFDTTPIGRIINRFSKDMYTVDEQLIATIRSYLATIASVIGVIVVISTAQPLFVVFLIPITIFYIMQKNFFNKTYREVKRLDSVARSPIYALLGETLDGVSSIRAFNAQEYLMRRIVGMLDAQQNAYFLTFTGQCWLAVRLELVGTVIITFSCLCAVIRHIEIGGSKAFASLAGLAISFALSVTQSLNWSVRMASDLEANMVAVERLEQYCQIPSEAARKTDFDDSPSMDVNWPTNGKIEFRNAELRYRKGLPLVLKGLNLVIPGRSKVGVVGRTGAGKSTLMVALMRIVELAGGSIMIDDVDIKKLGLTHVRSRIAVIPQDPVLFSGTVRINLDPFNECDDLKLYEVLRRVGLYSNPSSMNLLEESLATQNMTPIHSLNDPVLEGGQNFSTGQRQLLVIARALLSQASIVIMDEATAAVDADTDSKIQKIMREDFANATCITIAHRLNTIMDSDYILMMHDGRAAEFDKPMALLDKGGMFKDLVDAWEEEHE